MREVWVPEVMNGIILSSRERQKFLSKAASYNGRSYNVDQEKGPDSFLEIRAIESWRAKWVQDSGYLYDSFIP